MRSLRTSLLLSALLVLLGTLSGCSGGSSTTTEGEYIPPDGLPLADGKALFTAQSTAFSMLEDDSFSGVLRSSVQQSAVPDDDPQQLQSSIAYLITREARHGQVSIEPGDGAFTYTPDADFAGSDSFRFYVVADGLGSQQATVSIIVTGLNDPPEITAEIVTVTEQGKFYSTQVQGSDVDGDELTYQVENLPSWLSLNTRTGALFGLPQQSDTGIYEFITVSVFDPLGESATLPPFSIEVLDVNDSPTVNPAQFPQQLDARQRVVVNLFPDDPDGDFVTLQAELNDFVTVEILGGSLAVTAGNVIEVITINLVVIATDRLGKTSREIIPITLNPLTDSGRGRTLAGRKQGAGLHLVVLGDGYKVDEATRFLQHTDSLVSLMQSDPAVAAHLSGWNIHAVTVTSQDSGIDDNVLQDVRQTAFDSGYFCRGIQRLICADNGKVFGVALDEYPYLDQVVLLVNDMRYGGSGGAIAVASAIAPEIALHEMGHSVANLADEYVDSLLPASTTSGFVEGAIANVSRLNDPQRVPWSHWIADARNYPQREGEPGVGIFEGAFYQASEFYRPTSDSRMRHNDRDFGPVNGEQWALSVYRRTTPIIDFAPLSQVLQIDAGDTQTFSVTPLFGDAVQLVNWYVDGREQVLTENTNSFDFVRDSGEYKVQLSVRDNTGRIRLPEPHAGVFEHEWQVEVR